MDTEKNKLHKITLTDQLVNLIQGKQIINEDIRACTYFVLDAVVNAIAGSRTDTGKVLLNWWRTLNSPDPSRHSFLMGALIHTLEMDDLHKKSVTHPGCVVIPAAMAMAAREGASGQQLLIAILHGYEAMCRVGNAVGRSHYKYWHNTSSCGPFGSAMATGNLLGLTQQQQTWALGNAGTQSSGLWEFMNSGGMSKHLHAGRAAESGFLAADLARHGFSGPSQILEGDQGLFNAACPDAKSDEVTAKPDAPWHLTQTSIKPWPSCRHTHPAIDAALAIYPTIKTPIKVVTVHTYQTALDVCDRVDPSNEYQAKFSLQHCVASALINGQINFESFTDSAIANTDSLRNRVRLVTAAEIDAAYPDNWGCELEIVTDQNQTLKMTRLQCKGDPELPLSEHELLEKAKSLLGFAGINEDEQQRLISYILDIQNQSQIADITEILELNLE